MRWRAAGFIMLAFLPVARGQQEGQANARQAAIPSTMLAPDQTVAPSDEARKAQERAAWDNANANLRERILSMSLSPKMTVRDVVNQTHGNEVIVQACQNARQLGGPRWIDGRTCQVRLEIPGKIPAESLLAYVKQQPADSPIPPDALQARLADWDKLTFFAMGSSVGADSIELAQPRYQVGAWSDVPTNVRRQALGAAKHDAQRRILENIAAVPLHDHLLIQDALARPMIASRVQTWLNHQPVTKIEFLDDLRVAVTISAPADSLGGALQAAVTDDPEFAPGVSIDWNKVEQEIASHPAPAAGNSSAAAPAPPVVDIPTEAPGWVTQPLQAEGTATGSGPRLKVARAAEANAVAKLREQLLMLNLTPGHTVGDAAKSDPQLAAAIDRALLHAHTYKVDYRADGSVLVRITLDAEAAWAEIHSNP